MNVNAVTRNHICICINILCVSSSKLQLVLMLFSTNTGEPSLNPLLSKLALKLASDSSLLALLSIHFLFESKERAFSFGKLAQFARWASALGSTWFAQPNFRSSGVTGPGGRADERANSPEVTAARPNRRYVRANKGEVVFDAEG